MASKQPLHPTDSTGSSVLAQFPPRISLGSSVLASAINLPPTPHITYSVYTPSSSPTTTDPLDTIEQARKNVWQSNASRSVLDSLLSSVRITRNSLSLYVFALGSGQEVSAAETALRSLKLSGLSCECSFICLCSLCVLQNLFIGQ